MASHTQSRAASRAKPTRPSAIVGIGASDGGLAAMRQLLEVIPADSGIALVIVPERDAKQSAELPQLVAQTTALHTHAVTADIAVRPDHLYLVPQDATPSIEDGVLKLVPAVQGSTRWLPIDSFFESLAVDQAQRAIGVLLSPSAGEGAVGLNAIRSSGGITFAALEDAPAGQVRAVAADYQLSPDQIGQQLRRLARHPYVHGAAVVPEAAEGHRSWRDGVDKILAVLHAQRGVDFNLYRSELVESRIARRMALHPYKTSSEYARILRNDAAETASLFNELLSPGTGFFRSPDAFETLKQVVIPSLLRHQLGDPIRIWVPGCATGQDAYSVAIGFFECCERSGRAPNVQIFATDVNEAALERARGGVYAPPFVSDVSAERLRRYFAEDDGKYRIDRQVRSVITFARHNLLADPTFSKMDLVWCRNVLMLFEAETQARVLPVLHYALKRGGFLCIGSADSLGADHTLFAPVDPRHHIFTKTNAIRPERYLSQGERPRSSSRSRPPAPEPTPVDTAEHEDAERLRAAQRALVDLFAPPAMVVDADMRVVQTYGDLKPYLSDARFETPDVLSRVRAELMLPLQALLNRAKNHASVARKDEIRLHDPDAARTIDLRVVPLRSGDNRCFLIVFEGPRRAPDGQVEAPEGGDAVAAPGSASQASASGGPPSNSNDSLLAETLKELVDTREYLHSIQLQHDQACANLRDKAQAALRAKDDLQSINEELETSKEELESTNEELVALNEELDARNFELSRLNSDLNNLHLSIHSAIVVVDLELKIRRFTPVAAKLFNLLASDIGRSLSSIHHQLVMPHSAPGADSTGDVLPFVLEPMVSSVIDSLLTDEREVQDRFRRWYLLRVRPYITLENKVDGAVVAVIDIDALKRSQQEIERARALAEAAIRAMRDPTLILDRQLRVRTANDAYCRLFGVVARDVEGRSLVELADGAWNGAELQERLEAVLTEGSFSDLLLRAQFKGLGERTMLVSGRRIDTGAGTSPMIRLTIEDITGRKHSEDELRGDNQRLRTLLSSLTLTTWSTNPHGEFTTAQPRWEAYTGQSAHECAGLGWSNALHPEDRDRYLTQWALVRQSHTPFQCDGRVWHAASRGWKAFTAHATPIFDRDGQLVEWIGALVHRDDARESRGPRMPLVTARATPKRRITRRQSPGDSTKLS